MFSSFQFGITHGGISFTPTPTVNHIVNATVGPSGSVDLPGDNIVPNGGSITFNFTPNLGFTFDAVIVDSVPDSLINGSYTFANVITDHSISVTFKPLGPTIANAEVYTDGTYIVVNWERNIKNYNAFPSGFDGVSFTANNVPLTIVGRQQWNDRYGFRFNLLEVISSSQVVKVSYVPPLVNPLVDDNDLLAVQVTKFPVTNNSIV